MLLDDIHDYLFAQVTKNNQPVIVPPWTVYEGYFPDDVDTTIGLFETGGFPADSLGRENIRVTFQTRVRADRLNYDIARQKWLDIFNALADADQNTLPGYLSGYYYIQYMAAGPMFFNDDRGRPNFTSNWRVYMQRS
jgi:hypothetical protein